MGNLEGDNRIIVSIIMPTYNRAYIIRKAIDSVREQTFGNYELIIVDDGSIDDTESIVKGYDDDRIRYFKYEVNMGSNNARNRGLSEARGDYIAFLDSDNSWKPDHLKERMNKLSVYSDPVISFGRMSMVRDGNEQHVFPTGSSEVLSDRQELIRRMILMNRIDTNTVVLSKSCFGMEDGFDPLFSRLQDWDFFLKIILDGRNTILFDDRISVLHNKLNDSITNKRELYWSNRLRMIKKYYDQIVQYVSESEIVNQLAAEVQSDGCYSLMQEAAVTISDSKIFEIASSSIIMGAEREKKASFALRRILLHSKLNSGLFRRLKGTSYQTVALYGYGFFGKILLESLIDEGINVKYVIDRSNYEYNKNEIRFVNSLDCLNEVDTVFIAMPNDTEEVINEINRIKNVKIITLMDVLEENDGCGFC